MHSQDREATGLYEPAGQLHRAAPSSDPAPNEPRYAPGQILADRYRIVAGLGKGGMGEVYRADDLRVGQPVALKFLPESSAADADQLARFQKEIRLARQVSHPNICRVYDVAEHAGQPFLIMEYIDGEDLANLLRRVGRLSEEKALQIARELCAALAAVHDLGLLHRDLKPANVMLDGRGKVRLTDFGLATAAGDLAATNVRCGTPQYMAPEQLAGAKVSARSDLFGLGLVLYELFTGLAAYHGIDRSHAPGKPSSHLKTMDPLVEQAILHCLQHDPDDRPRSAYEVLAELPGGDPLTAALALGNTPSPEAVANAAIEGSLRPWIAAALLVAVLLGVFGVARLNDLTRLFRQVPLADAAPEVLAHRARELVREFGYVELPKGSALGYAEDRPLTQSPKQDGPAGSIHGPTIYFWYRQSPLPLTNTAVIFVPGFVLLPGWVKPAEPPLTVPGMATVALDLKGNLLEFGAVPAQHLTERSGVAPTPDWSALFGAAGLDMTRFRVALDPRHTPPVYADSRQAWDGPDSTGSPVRVEAAAFQGRPVYFYSGPVDRADRLDRARRQQRQFAGVFVSILMTVAFTAGGLLAWRNVRQGRANLPGAWRLAIFAFALHLVAWALIATHVPVFADEVGIFCGLVGLALLDCSLLALWYLVLEPFVRRRWPWIMVGWNRLLAGRGRDPMVGRDLLIGGLAGVSVALLVHARALLSVWLEQKPPASLGIRVDLLGHGPAVVLNPLLDGLFGAMGKFFLMAVFVGVLRRVAWGFAAAFLANVFLTWTGAIAAGLPPLPGGPPVLSASFAVVSTAILFTALLRFGLLAYVSATACFAVLVCAPLTTDLSAWYRSSSLEVWLAVTGLGAYGFVVSLGGRRQFLKAFLGNS